VEQDRCSMHGDWPPPAPQGRTLSQIKYQNNFIDDSGMLYVYTKTVSCARRAEGVRGRREQLTRRPGLQVCRFAATAGRGIAGATLRAWARAPERAADVTVLCAGSCIRARDLCVGVSEAMCVVQIQPWPHHPCT
jgi:hypothetical protein